MIKKILLLLLLIIPVSGYSQNKKLFEIDPRSFGDNKITLSEIADDISYIPLDNAIPIGNVTRILLNTQNIYILSRDAGILKFDRSGKFLCKIGKTGRGPGEYIAIMSFTVDEQSGNVFIQEINPNSSIKVYSPIGNFIRDIKLERDLLLLPGDIKFFNSKIFLSDYNSLGNSKNIWIIIDTLGNVISKKSNSTPPFKNEGNRSIGAPGNVFEYDNNLFYCNSYNDTVFCITKDFKYNAAYLFAHGEFRIPASFVTREEFNNKLFSPTGIGLFQTRQFIMLRHRYLGKISIAVIDKNSWKVYNVPSFINDIDCGIPFFPNYYHYDINTNAEYLAITITPFDLKKHIVSDEFRKVTSGNPQKKKEFETLVSKLDESDNPVLMLVRLKK